MSFNVMLAVLVVVLGALLALGDTRSERPRQRVNWKVWCIIAIGVLSAAQSLWEHFEASQAEEEANRQHAEVVRVGSSSGKLLHPSVLSNKEVMEVIIGDNVITCASEQQIDFGRALSLMAPFPLGASGPYLSVVNRNGRLYVSATVCNSAGEEIAIVEENEFRISPNSEFSVKAKPNQLTITDAKGAVLLDVLLLSARQVRVRGLFYTPLYECTIDDQGVTCNARSDKAPIKVIEVRRNKLNIVHTQSSSQPSR